jgi:hypothetical protein
VISFRGFLENTVTGKEFNRASGGMAGPLSPAFEGCPSGRPRAKLDGTISVSKWRVPMRPSRHGLCLMLALLLCAPASGFAQQQQSQPAQTPLPKGYEGLFRDIAGVMKKYPGAGKRFTVNDPLPINPPRRTSITPVASGPATAPRTSIATA